MTLFDDKVDVSVKSPNTAEWERIEKQLKANVKAAKKIGGDELKWAISDYEKHQQKRDAYVEAGQKQLNIFDF